MKNMYFSKAALALGVAAIASAPAFAEGAWVSANSYLKNPAFLPGWTGALTAVAEGVGETYDAPFEIYQVIENAPAGEYTLTVNASYRAGGDAVTRMQNGENNNGYVFLGTQKVKMLSVYEYGTEGTPNSLAECNAAFSAGKYLNTVTYNHAGGDLKVGVGATIDLYTGQWTTFDNFKVTGPNGDVALVNGDFSAGIENADNPDIWDMHNVGGKIKTVDICKDFNGGRGCYRKTNASEYNFGQYVSLPAGKYRFGVQSFIRYGNGNEAGWYINIKGSWSITEGESAYDRHVNGSISASDSAYIYVAESEFKPYEKDDWKDCDMVVMQPIMSIFDVAMDVYPDNEPATETVPEGYRGWCDSGFEQEAAQYFITHPDKYRNYVEFELTEAKSVWVGLKKDSKTPAFYWNPFREFTLEKWDANAAGVENVVVEDEDAPAVYYNLQGIRVANPENGIYIVKKGNKVSKVVL